MKKIVPIRIVIEEPGEEPREVSYHQQMIKIGRGREGKSKKGVDLQLSDPKVERVHAVIHARRESDVFLMAMGGGKTFIDGQQIGAKGKLKSYSEIQIGETKLTVFIGELALEPQLPKGWPPKRPESFTSPASSSEKLPPLTDGSPFVSSVGEIGDMAGVQGTALSGEGEIAAVDSSDILDEQSVGQVSGEDWREAFSPSQDRALSAVGEQRGEGVSGESNRADSFSSGAVSSSETGGSGEASRADSPSSAGGTGPAGFQTDGYAFYPPHQTPFGQFYGPWGPVPPILPGQNTIPRLEVALDVFLRLQREFWIPSPHSG